MAAVEVADGDTAVRVKERFDEEDSHGDPEAAARAWRDQGAQWFHLADLDAQAGTGDNRTVLEGVRRALGHGGRTQLAGGIRSAADVATALSQGFDQVVLDAAALTATDWLPEVLTSHGHRVVAGVDVHRGALWAPGSAADGADLATVLAGLVNAGCRGYVLTDIDHEGTRKGPDEKLIRQVCAATRAPVCVAGGIARLEHLHELATLVGEGVVAAVLDAALYDDYFSFAEAMAAVAPRFDPYQWGPAQPWGLTQGL